MSLPEETAPPLGPGPQTLRLGQDGTVRHLWPIVLVNALLNIITLTIYRFWARTHVRRFLWSGTTLLDDRFEYTGTGRELFLGFLIVLGVVILPFIAVNAAAQYFWAEDDPIRYGGFIIVVYVLVLFLVGMALYRARRFRLSRTAWRGIRPALAGRSWVYGLLYLAIYLANGATMGWSYPWGRIRLMEQILNETYFGDRPFRFEGRAGPLYRRFAVLWCGGAALFFVVIVLAVVIGIALSAGTHTGKTDKELVAQAVAGGVGAAMLIGFLPLGALFAWYKAKELSYIAECTRFEGLSFRFDVTTWSLIRLVVGNYLILVLTLSFGYPFAQLRKFRYLCQRLEAVGEVDFESIRQSAHARPSIGEGLADAFDLGGV